MARVRAPAGPLVRARLAVATAAAARAQPAVERAPARPARSARKTVAPRSARPAHPARPAQPVASAAAARSAKRPGRRATAPWAARTATATASADFLSLRLCFRPVLDHGPTLDGEGRLLVSQTLGVASGIQTERQVSFMAAAVDTQPPSVPASVL